MSEPDATIIGLLGMKYLLLGALFLSPIAATAGGPLGKPAAIYNLSEEPLIADLRRVSSNENAQAGERREELSEFWKYTIAIAALVFFLGIALFIQIRSEREK